MAARASATLCLDVTGSSSAATLRNIYQYGEALWEKIVELGLEGVVAKRRSGHYLPGLRGWIKPKNRAY